VPADVQHRQRDAYEAGGGRERCGERDGIVRGDPTPRRSWGNALDGVGRVAGDWSTRITVEGKQRVFHRRSLVGIDIVSLGFG